jgi:hypothetical protein
MLIIFLELSFRPLIYFKFFNIHISANVLLVKKGGLKQPKCQILNK